MDFIGPLLTFILLWKFCSCQVKCYSCDECPTNFESSDQYLKYCELSSMCYKKVSTLDFGNGVTSQGVQRGCAAQTQDGEQKKVNRKWVQVRKIYDVYEEKCSEDTTNPERITKTLLCYCKGDKCNSAVIHNGFIILILMALVLIMLS